MWALRSLGNFTRSSRTWIRVDTVVVEILRQRRPRLPHGLALVRTRGQCGDQRRHLVDGDLVDPAMFESRSDLEDPRERRPVHVAGLDLDVYARLAPAL
jgi:hypothetical protein